MVAKAAHPSGSKLHLSPLLLGEGTGKVRKPFSSGRRVGMRANLVANHGIDE
jgi:hypothetical protein